MKSVASALFFSAFLSLSASASHHTVIVKDISLSFADSIAQHAVHHCATLGYKVTATVVDQAGHIKAIHRADGAGPHTLDSARRKAYTSVSTRAKTSALLAASQSNPASANLGEIDQFLLLGGGVPVTDAGATIGAVGVGGAPSGSIDETCAEMGINLAMGK